MSKTLAGSFRGSVIRVLCALLVFTGALSIPAFRYNHVIRGKRCQPGSRYSRTSVLVEKQIIGSSVEIKYAVHIVIPLIPYHPAV